MGREAKPRDRVEIVYGGKKYVGVLMQRPERADPNHITLKLSSGYDIGLDRSKITSLKVLESIESKSHETSSKKPVVGISGSKPLVSVLATGGTIASRVDYLTGGVHSAFSAQELISAVPELSAYANVSGKQVFNKFSENISPTDWVTLASEVYSELKRGVSGVVITHGTDTMGYSAAALSFMLKTPVPVVFTGAQRSSDRGSSDAAVNLTHSVRVAAEGDLSGVFVVMHGGSSDTTSLIHNGVNVRKLHSSARGAFQSVNVIPSGSVDESGVKLADGVVGRRGEIDLDAKIDEHVALLKYYPGLGPKYVDFLVSSGVKGIVVEGSGLGHVCDGLFKSLGDAGSSGVSVAMTSQTIHGRVNMDVYSTGRRLLELGVIPCGGMISETAYVKLMWVLGHTKQSGKVRDMMVEDMRGEMANKSPIV